MSEFTNPNEYQELAKRTQCDQRIALNKLILMSQDEKLQAVSLLHAVIGIAGELGELAAGLEKWLWYGQSFDKVNFKEELGDVDWYLAEAHNALGIERLETMRANIRKLRGRYPDKFSEELAKEENRDRETERENVEPSKEDGQDAAQDAAISNEVKVPVGVQNGQGWAEIPWEDPPEEKEPVRADVSIRNSSTIKGLKVKDIPKDGFDVAEDICIAFVEGQNRDYAIKVVEQARKNYEEYRRACSNVG